MITEDEFLKANQIVRKYKNQLKISDGVKYVEIDQLILVEPDKIHETFELIKKENRRSYNISKEDAKNLADFIYVHLHGS